MTGLRQSAACVRAALTGAPRTARNRPLTDGPREGATKGDGRMDNAPEVLDQIPLVPDATQSAIHRGASDLPYVDLGDGSEVQLLQVDLTVGLWVVRARFAPGYTILPHYHTGSVFAVTTKGSWYYKEQPEVMNTAGSYLFEPAGSFHTLTVPEDQEGTTEAWFAVYGANIMMDYDKKVVAIVDAPNLLALYRAKCAELGLPEPDVIVMGE